MNQNNFAQKYISISFRYVLKLIKSNLVIPKIRSTDVLKTKVYLIKSVSEKLSYVRIVYVLGT